MNAEHEAHLVESYPILYSNYAGISTGDGWFVIVDTLSAELEWLNRSGAVRITYAGSKEKFGTLRYIVVADVLADDFPISMVWALTDSAETLSASTCEECGEYGSARPGGWVRTLCRRCHEELLSE